MASGASAEHGRRSPTVIELVGAPGAGKSALLPAVIRACESAGLRAYTVVDAARPFTARTVAGRLVHAVIPPGPRRSALWLLFRCFRLTSAVAFAAQHPRLARYVMGSARGRPTAAQARDRKVVHWYVRLAGSYRFLLRQARPDETLVLDEGFAHRAVQLHTSSVEVPDAGRIASYASMIPRADLLVHVRAPVSVAEQRVLARGGWGRSRGGTPDQLSHFVANAHRATELIAEAAAASGWSVVTIDNAGSSLTEAEERITDLVSVSLGRLAAGEGVR